MKSQQTCKKCGAIIWYYDGLQRCPDCGTRSYAKDPFVGITDAIIIAECKKRGLWSDNAEENLKNEEKIKFLNEKLKKISQILKK